MSAPSRVPEADSLNVCEAPLAPTSPAACDGAAVGPLCAATRGDDADPLWPCRQKPFATHCSMAVQHARSLSLYTTT